MDPICRGLRRLFSSFLASICAGRSQVDLRDLITEADLRLEEGRLDPALKLYRKAAGIDPGSSAVKKSAVVLGMMGRYMEAIASLDRAIDIDPLDHEIWMLRGFLFLRLKRWQEALRSFERAAALSPEDGYPRYCWTQTAEEAKRRRSRR